MTQNTTSAASGQSPLAPAAGEFLEVLNELQRSGHIPVDKELLEDLTVRHAIGMLTESEALKATRAIMINGDAVKKTMAVVTSLFQPGDIVELCAIPPRGGAIALHGDPHDPKQRAQLAEFVQNQLGYASLYIGVCPRKPELSGVRRRASDAEVLYRRHIVLDLDDKDAPTVDDDWSLTLEALDNLHPALKIRSGNGWQLWFNISEQLGFAMIESTSALKDAQAAIGADNTGDLSRLMRLPYTLNIPNKSKRSRGYTVRLAAPSGAPLFQNGATFAPGEFCEAMRGLAANLSLPGRSTSRPSRKGGGGKPKSASGSDAESKAPPLNVFSLDLLKQLMEGMPNPDHFGRHDQVGVANAVKGAVCGTDFEDEGRLLFLNWSAKWCGSDPVEDARIYDTLGTPKNDWSSLIHICRKLAPELAQKVRSAEAKAVFSAAPIPNGVIDAIAARTTQSKSARTLDGLVMTPSSAPIAANIPPRKWLYGHHLISGSLSLTVAPGGTGKSVLTMTEAVAMATGQTVYAGDTPTRPLRVWVHNAEDPQDELNRRLAAITKHFGITDNDLGDRLFLTSGRDVDLCLAKSAGGDHRVEPGIEGKLVDFIKRHRIDVLVLDPLGATHTLPENDNTAVNVLLGALRRIMERTNVAIQAVHHTGKQAASDMKGTGAAAARGASAWVDGARNVRQIARMSETDAQKLGIPPEYAYKYIRVDNGKANLAPVAKASWRKIEPVNLGNSTAEYPLGDTVGVPVDWALPAPMSSTITASDLQRVQVALCTNPQVSRQSPQSPDWVGYLVADALDLDVGDRGSRQAERSAEQNHTRMEVKNLVNGWLETGELVQERTPNPNRQKGGDIVVIRVGKPADIPPDKAAGGG